jgi:hypothetical protein
MATLKRTKGGKELWAGKISAAGVVVEWGPESSAFQFDSTNEDHRKLAEKVVEHYKARAGVGALFIGGKPINDHKRAGEEEQDKAAKAAADAKAHEESLATIRQKAAHLDTVVNENRTLQKRLAEVAKELESKDAKIAALTADLESLTKPEPKAPEVKAPEPKAEVKKEPHKAPTHHEHKK